MNPRSCDRWLVRILMAAGACAPLPLYGQSAPYYFPYGAQPQWAVAAPGWAGGAGAGAHIGAQVSAMNPMIHCTGGRSFACGARLGPRPMFVGALIGGMIGHALSFPHESAPVQYYGATYSTPERSLESQRRAEHRAPSIADGWTQIGEVQREGSSPSTAARSQFIEDWQRFFEPSAQASSGGAGTKP